VAISVQYYLLPLDNIAVDKQYRVCDVEAMTRTQESKIFFWRSLQLMRGS
jgi:hypothetical protein